MYQSFIQLVRDIYRTSEFIPLHAPRFNGNEKTYVVDAIDSTFVSSVGAYVDRFEKEFAEFVGVKYAVAAVNGTNSLHIALILAGVLPGEEVITQPLTFVATCNAIAYAQASPIFVDVDLKTLGLSAEKLQEFFEQHTIQRNEQCINKLTNKVIRACIPMHTFGHPAEINLIAELCHQYNVMLVEDVAEGLGSYYQDKHLGNRGALSIFSFNGNKVLTTGGGGMIVTNDPVLAKRAKHLTTTAKQAHPWEYVHDEVGYNYRMPNLNAALGVAQLEQLPHFLAKKRKIAEQYQDFFNNRNEGQFVIEPKDAKSNYWLNAIVFNTRTERDSFLKITNEAGVMTRPAWQLMNRLPMYQHCFTASDDHAEYLSDRLVNIPSGVPNHE